MEITPEVKHGSPENVPPLEVWRFRTWKASFSGSRPLNFERLVPLGGFANFAATLHGIFPRLSN